MSGRVGEQSEYSGPSGYTSWSGPSGCSERGSVCTYDPTIDSQVQ